MFSYAFTVEEKIGNEEEPSFLDFSDFKEENCPDLLADSRVEDTDTF
jgi:hypothetical protein